MAACGGGGISGSDSSSRYSKGSNGFRAYPEFPSALALRFSRTRDVVETVVVESNESRGDERESFREEPEGESCNNECFSCSRTVGPCFDAMLGRAFQLLLCVLGGCRKVDCWTGEAGSVKQGVLPVHNGAW